MKKIEVVAAVFIKDNLVFCAQRKDAGPLAKKWEFPGGKIEVGETKEEALIREIKEELEMDIKIDHFIMTVKHQYPTFFITMHAFLCKSETSYIKSNEHLDSKWMSPSELDTLDWAEADLPIVEELKRILRG